jgi:hypothetical protein
MPIVYYPAIIERGRRGYGVFFPDLPGCTSTGRTVTEAAGSGARHRRRELVPGTEGKS